MKGVASMVVEAIKRYPLLVIFMLVLLLVMIFAIVYYRMSKKYEKSQIELKESLLACPECSTNIRQDIGSSL